MLKEKLQNVKIILASGSPRRQQFFKDFDIDFEIRIKDVEEIYPDNLVKEEITIFLAKLKAASQKSNLAENEILISSDTIVWLNNEAIGKPKDYADAQKMLAKLSGKTHEVITSVCFLSKKKCEVITDVTKVKFSILTSEMIDFYINKCAPFDKAGAYGIQDWIGLVGVSSVEGSYTNVMGLPTEKVFKYLNELQ